MISFKTPNILYSDKRDNVIKYLDSQISSKDIKEKILTEYDKKIIPSVVLEIMKKPYYQSEYDIGKLAINHILKRNQYFYSDPKTIGTIICAMSKQKMFSSSFIAKNQDLLKENCERYSGDPSRLYALDIKQSDLEDFYANPSTFDNADAIINDGTIRVYEDISDEKTSALNKKGVDEFLGRFKKNFPINFDAFKKDMTSARSNPKKEKIESIINKRVDTCLNTEKDKNYCSPMGVVFHGSLNQEYFLPNSIKTQIRADPKLYIDPIAFKLKYKTQYDKDAYYDLDDKDIPNALKKRVTGATKEKVKARKEKIIAESTSIGNEVARLVTKRFSECRLDDVKVTQTYAVIDIECHGERTGDELFTPRPYEEDDDYPAFNGAKLMNFLRDKVSSDISIDYQVSEKGWYSIELRKPIHTFKL